MTISRARKKMTAAEDKAKADAISADKKKDAAYTALVKAWGEADEDTQEKFVSEYKIDLADLLRSMW